MQPTFRRGITLPSARTFFVLFIVIGLIIAAAGWWHYEHRPKPVVNVQQQDKVNNSIQNQKIEAAQEEQQNRPSGTKSITYSNLAESYAYTGNCDDAKTALNKAKGYATPDTSQSVQNSAQAVKYYCH